MHEWAEGPAAHDFTVTALTLWVVLFLIRGDCGPGFRYVSIKSAGAFNFWLDLWGRVSMFLAPCSVFS